LLHNDIDVVLVLEDIQKADNVRVLAHFENLNLASLQLDVLNGHLFLGHDLDSDRLAGLFVDS